MNNTYLLSHSVQYSTADDGSSLGVTVTRNALLTHCRSLTTACLYREGEPCKLLLSHCCDVARPFRRGCCVHRGSKTINRTVAWNISSTFSTTHCSLSLVCMYLSFPSLLTISFSCHSFSSPSLPPFHPFHPFLPPFLHPFLPSSLPTSSSSRLLTMDSMLYLCHPQSW